MIPAVAVSEQVVSALRAVLGDELAALHEPLFVGNERRYVQECLDSTFVSSAGRFVDRFERELADYTGAEHVVAVVNGTAALHVALRVAGVRAGEEVLTPALSFVATANAVSYCGAVPHFVDSEERTLGVDSAALRDYLQTATELQAGVCVNRTTGRAIRALIAMHTFGHPVDLDALLAVARDFRLAFVEDAAESLGSIYRGRHTGTFGMAGTLSFNGNKTVTTGGGGAVLTDDREFAARVRHLTTTARVPHQWSYVHDEVGYNYRMPGINAALGCAQLEQLSGFLAAKRILTGRYAAAFEGVPSMRLFTEPAECSSNYWLQTLLLEDAVAEQRDEVLAATHAAGFLTRPCWTLMHRLPPYRNAPRAELPVAESIERRLISLPSSAQLASRVPRGR